MAFSTQKEFFRVPFMNENFKSNCNKKKACVKLKSYESTEDTRSWANDETQQSKFLSDLVTCENPDNLSYGENLEDLSSTDNQLKQYPASGHRTADLKGNKSAGRSGYSGKIESDYHGSTSNGNSQSDYRGNSFNENREGIFLQSGGDSVIECANVYLAEYQKVLKIKTSLEKQLEVSNERLKTANEENKKIRAILDSKLDSNTTKDFYNKIQKFTAAGKFSKNEENEMLQIYQKMENMNKAYEILQAGNNYLKRLIEKLTRRVTLESITTNPEKSEDIPYLQNEINSLRKECILLRQMEEDCLKTKQQQTNELHSISEQDAENIKAIIKERNSLREKCKSFKALEQQVKEMEHITQEAKKGAVDLNSTLANQTQYINEMEKEMQIMQKYYEEKLQNVCLREECLKAQVEDLKEEIINVKCEAQKANILSMEVSCLRNEVLKRDISLNEYDCQYKQLMDVVNELQSVQLQGVHDNQTQTCKDQTDELTFYTRATLSEIMKELKRRGSFREDYMAVYELAPAPDGTNVEYDDHCCPEMKRLQQETDELREKLHEAADCEYLCANALEQLKEQKAKNAKLLLDNQDLKEKLKEGEEKMIEMLKKMENLDKEVSRNGQEANQIGKDLQGAIDLVKDISEVQLKNQQLASAVSAINSRDDQKIIDDLHRQLEEETNKLKKCQQDNAKLLEEIKANEMDLKELKDINNKLEANRTKLQADYNKLLTDNIKLEKEFQFTTLEEKPKVVDINDEVIYNEDNLIEYPSNEISIKRYEKQVESNSSLNYHQNYADFKQSFMDISEYKYQKDNFEPSNKKDDNGQKKQPSRNQQKSEDLNEFIMSSSDDAATNPQSQANQKAIDFHDEIAISPSKAAVKKEPSQADKKFIDFDEFAISKSKEAVKKQPSQADKKDIEFHDEFARSPSDDAAKNPQSQVDEKAIDFHDEFAISISKEPVKKQPSQIDQKVVEIDEFATSPSKDAVKKQPSQADQKIIEFDEFATSPSKDAVKKQPSQADQKSIEFDEFATSPSKDAVKKQPSQADQKIIEFDEFAISSSKDAGKKQHSQAVQKAVNLNKTVISPSKNTAAKQQKKAQQRAAEIPEFEIDQSNDLAKQPIQRSQQRSYVKKQSKRAQQKEIKPPSDVYETSSLEAINKQLKREEQKLGALDEYVLSRDQQKDLALNEFVIKKSDTLRVNLQKGRSFEKEFRNILEEFVLECSYCFCRLLNTKSTLYVICHKLCHKGLSTLKFQELAYLHKKIYAQADQLVPGCLLNMILSEHKEQVERKLTSMEMLHAADNKKIDFKISDKSINYVDQKCCCCKNELCCNYSEEMLKDKVNKLEKDIEIAREYLETLRNIPLESNVGTDNGDSTDTNNSTYRASSPIVMSQKLRYSKHLKKLKNRMINHPST